MGPKRDCQTGPKKLMSFLSPEGPIYQAGTLSGNPLTMTAGLATLKQLKNEDYRALTQKTKCLIKGLKERASAHDITLQTTACGGMFGFFFSEQPVDCLEKIPPQHAEYFNIFHGIMQKNGIHFALYDIEDIRNYVCEHCYQFLNFFLV